MERASAPNAPPAVRRRTRVHGPCRSIARANAGSAAASAAHASAHRSTPHSRTVAPVARTNGVANGTAFAHGVASGDPRADGVLIWTRVSGADRSVDVRWTVGADPELREVVASGTA